MSADRIQELSFSGISIGDLLGMTTEEVDSLPFGVVGLSNEAVAEVYNRQEAIQAGIQPESVLGTQFFLSTAQCMNNFMVAQRLQDEAELDTTIEYVLTFRMRPTPVRVRLLKTAELQRSYLLIQR